MYFCVARWRGKKLAKADFPVIVEELRGAGVQCVRDYV